MEVNLQVHLQAADNVVLHRVHSGNFKGDPALNRSHYVEHPIEVKLPVVGASIVGIPLEVVHPVGVDLAGNHLHDLLVFITVVDDAGDLVGKLWRNPPEDPVNVGSGAGNQLAGDLLVVRFEDVFKGVGIRAVAKVMQEGGTEGDGPFAVVPAAITSLLVGIISLEIVAHFPGNFVNPETVAEAGVLGTVEGKGGGAELLDSPQPLEFWGVD